VEALRPLPASLRKLWPVRNLGVISGVVFLGLAVALPLLITHSDAVTLTSIMAFSIVGLSIGLLTGLGGQLTLGQFGIAAIGAVISLDVAGSTGNYPLAF